MTLPRFSMKQLLVSVLWISIGFGGVAFSLNDWNLPLQRAYDWLAREEQPVRMAARVIGWTFVCIGVIPLVTRRRPARVLILALWMVVPGAMIGYAVQNTLFPGGPRNIDRGGEVIPWVCMALGSVVAILLAGITDCRRPPRDSSCSN
jgi:hypothetical protein